MKNLRKLSEHLYVYDFEKETDRPNLYYIKGRDYSVAVDAGNSRKHLESFYAAVEDAGFDMPRYTVISHWHWDHTFGLCALKGTSISSKLTHKYLAKVMRWKWVLPLMLERLKTGEEIAFCHDNIIREYPDLSEIRVVNTMETIDSQKTLDLGDIEVQLIPRPSTHSLDSTFVYLPSERSLIVEDADCEDFYHGGVYDQKRLKEMIEFFEALDYDWHYLGHADRESKAQALERLKAEKK